jgi:flagellar basal-body rod protein FlgF
MANGIYAALSGALNNVRRIEIVSHNLANVSTPAFKMERMATEAVAPPANADGELTFAMPAVQQTDLSQGPLLATENPMDIALSEGTYLQVLDNEKTAYMRGATLAAMPDGTLATSEGHAVYGDHDLVKIPPGALEIVIGANGDVVVDGARIDRLRLVSFENEQGLLAGSDRTLIDPTGNSAVTTTTQAPVMVGYQEKANLSMIKQMTDMIAAHRLYDVTMNAINTHRQVESKAAREIAGRF